MPVLAGWLTGEQVPLEIIEQTLAAMGSVLGQHGGQPSQTVHPGAGLIAFSDTAYAMQHNDDPPVLDWVPNRRTLVYRRSLSGLHTLYYVENWPAEGNLLFASEIKALLAVGVPRRLHLAALDALLRYGFIPAPWTAFKDIHVVPAGSILRWQRAKTVVNQATDYHLTEPLPQTDLREQLSTQLDEATAAILPPHEHLTALSGGSSSSALATLFATHHTATPFSLVTLGYTKSTLSKAWKETERIAQLCEHPFLAIVGVDQPESWAAPLVASEAPCLDTRLLALHQLLHTTAAETGARVAISGLGSHILLGTSITQGATQVPPHNEQHNMLDHYRQLLTIWPSKQLPQLWSQEAKASLQEEQRWEETSYAGKLARRAAQFTSSQQTYYYLDLHLRLPDLIVSVAQQLATQERMIMRSPYLKAHIINTLTRLPATLEDGTPKHRLLSLLAQRSIEPRTTSPLRLAAPTASLLDIAKSDLLQQMLLPDALRATGIFDLQAVEILQRQTKGKKLPKELLLVFTTQLFCKLFEVNL